MKAKPYYMLFVREKKEDKWSPEFGGYTRHEVYQERTDSYRSAYRVSLEKLPDDTFQSVQHRHRFLNLKLCQQLKSAGHIAAWNCGEPQPQKGA